MTSTPADGSASTTGGPVRAVLVGAGNRGLCYSRYSHRAPEQLVITAVVDPDDVRRNLAAEEFGVPEDRCYRDLDSLPDVGVLADAAINATMDPDHVPTARWLLNHGYPVLLEKPIASTVDEVLELSDEADRTGQLVMVCHVLRYSPFYEEIKKQIDAGHLGQLISIEMAEYVSYDHMAASYARGKWANTTRSGSGILLSKCCHDIDLMTWLAGRRPLRATSTGSRAMFVPQQAPVGAGTRCVVDCDIEDRCFHSARRQYIELDLWPSSAWRSLQHLGPDLTEADKLASLAGDNPFGECVYRTDADVLDRQAVTVQFDGNIVGSFTLATSTVADRTITIMGTDGQLSGSLASGTITMHQMSRHSEELAVETIIRTSVDGGMHGGGDHRLVQDFIDATRGAEPSVSFTSIERSIDGHLVVFAAELGRTQQRWVQIDELRQPAHSR